MAHGKSSEKTQQNQQALVRVADEPAQSPNVRGELTLPVPQPHARPVAVLVDEDHAGGFEGGADGG